MPGLMLLIDDQVFGLIHGLSALDTVTSIIRSNAALQRLAQLPFRWNGSVSSGVPVIFVSMELEGCTSRY